MDGRLPDGKTFDHSTKKYCILHPGIYRPTLNREERDKGRDANLLQQTKVFLRAKNSIFEKISQLNISPNRAA